MNNEIYGDRVVHGGASQFAHLHLKVEPKFEIYYDRVAPKETSPK